MNWCHFQIVFCVLFNSLIKAILHRILVDVVIRAQFELKIAFMVRSDLNCNFHFLSRFEIVYNDSISISSRNFMRFRSIPRIATNATFSSKILLVLWKRAKTFLLACLEKRYVQWLNYNLSTTKTLIIIVIWWGWIPISPHTGSRGWIS